MGFLCGSFCFGYKGAYVSVFFWLSLADWLIENLQEVLDAQLSVGLQETRIDVSGYPVTDSSM